MENADPQMEDMPQSLLGVLQELQIAAAWDLPELQVL
jgi:hypothetical protein